MLRNSLFSKTAVIVLLAILLLIPLSMIQSKISERQALQRDVQQDIARSASGPQTLTGPYLVLRYKLTERRTIKDREGNEKVAISTSMHHKVIMPSKLTIEGDAGVETRHRGIYQARLFNLNADISGKFEVPQGYGIDKPLADIKPIAAYFVMKVSDARGIRNVPVLTLDGKKHAFAPGRVGPGQGNGIHAQLQAFDVARAHSFAFEFPFELQGMSSLDITPSGSTTRMTLASSWPHPSFGGSYLPRTRSVNDKGFTAEWLVTNLARNNGLGTVNCGDSFSVSFIDPVNVYLLSERAVKYGILFIVLVFAGFFMFEMLRSLRIHPMQYLLVGLALAMFFLLIISLSEHIPFLTAYVASGAACVALIGIYLAGVLKSAKPALAFSGGIALLYAVLYGVLQSEDNALLMGTLVLFTALAAMMVLSRKMDWYSFSGSQGDSSGS